MYASVWTRGIATLGLAAAMLGCASLPRQSAKSAALCYPSQCLLEVNNDIGRIIAVRYYDSTGVGDVLGAVQPLGVRHFALSRRTSRTITVEVSRDKEVFRSRATISRSPSENILHFPADFEAILARSGSR